MGKFGDRLKHALPQETLEKRPKRERLSNLLDAARSEELSGEEKQALGRELLDGLEALRADSPPRVGLDEWNVLLERVERELKRPELTAEEKRDLRRDAALAKPSPPLPGKAWALAGIALAGACLAAWKLGWLAFLL